MATRSADNAQVQALRAFIDAKKRAIEAADGKYDIRDAVANLESLAAPLCRSSEFPPGWKQLYLDVFYRDVAGFVLGFVAVHIEICLSDAERLAAFDVFFDRSTVPAVKSVAALASILSATKAPLSSNPHAAGDAAVTIGHCLRLLERVISDGGLGDIVETLLTVEQPFSDGGGRNVYGYQALIGQLIALPDLVHNRRRRDSPSVFRPRRYFQLLCDSIFQVVGSYCAQNAPPAWQRQYRSAVVRMLSDRIIRVGQVGALIQSWFSAIEGGHPTSSSVAMHGLMLRSVPDSCYEKFFKQIAAEPAPASPTPVDAALKQPKYVLLAYLPDDVVSSKQFQYVVGHKLLLTSRVEDLFVWRTLVDVLQRVRRGKNGDDAALMTPLAAVFDTVLSRWSQGGFAVSSDYAQDASVSFFLRYAMQKMVEEDASQFEQRDWTAQLCKGVQDHMNHSVERVRLLGMRVGETLSKLLSPDNPLDFEITEDDPLDVYGASLSSVDEMMEGISLGEERTTSGSVQQASSTRKVKSKHKRQSAAFTLDPDAVVASDDEDDNDDGLSADGDDTSSENSDSDMSLDAYDLDDDESDLRAQRPVYLKDLIAALIADNEREKTEAALEEAERLLRRHPRDLHENSKEVVTALLRLENKYDTPNFSTLRLRALAAACALSPAKTLPYLLSQALEREQLLQSRIDILHAMTKASQELSETGDFKVTGPKTLLRTPSSMADELESRTMERMKTHRFGYRRDPAMPAKKNVFADHALAFFSPLLFGYIEYRRQHEKTNGLSEIEHVFLAHLLHALACFVESAGNAPQTISMAKCLMEFAWVERSNKEAAVRRQVLFALSRVLLVVPPFLLRQELGESIVEMVGWLQQVYRRDPDQGCRDASRLLLGSSMIPTLSLP